MRTLGKLRHEHQSAAAKAAAPTLERGKVRAQERSVWRRRAVALLRLVAVVALGWFVGAVCFAVGRTAEGVVVVPSSTITAPARVRVVRLFCRDGDRVERGQPLAELEPVVDTERDVLVSRLQRSRIRFALVQGGAALEEVDLGGRTDAVVQAQLVVQQALDAERRAELEATGLTRSREALAVALHQDKAGKQGTLAVLAEQLREAHARVVQAQATLHERQRHAAERQALAEQGIVAGRELDSTRAAVEDAAQEVAAREAAVQALERARTTAANTSALEDERASAALAQIDTAIARARATAEQARREAAAWRGTVARRDALLPRRDVPPTELVALEHSLLAAEVAEREAELRAHDARVGRTTIRAEHAGIVDRVHTIEGSVLEPSQSLLVCFDPDTAWVEAFVPASQTPPVVGTDVALVPEGAGAELPGRITAVGRILVPPPPTLAASVTAALERFVPVRVQATGRLLANQRVRVVFPLGGR
jgi:multidrug resistance efflux pump